MDATQIVIVEAMKTASIEVIKQLKEVIEEDMSYCSTSNKDVSGHDRCLLIIDGFIKDFERKFEVMKHS